MALQRVSGQIVDRSNVLEYLVREWDLWFKVKSTNTIVRTSVSMDLVGRNCESYRVRMEFCSYGGSRPCIQVPVAFSRAISWTGDVVDP